MPAPVFTSGPFTGIPTTDAFALAAMNELFANRDTRNPARVRAASNHHLQKTKSNLTWEMKEEAA
jgi:hypothetical protein